MENSENPKKESREKFTNEKSQKLAKLIREFYGNLPDLPGLTDEAFWNLCNNYSALCLVSRYKFVGLLPEAERRRIWEKRGFSSIFEFGAKLAGLSVEQVKLALSLDHSFVDKPFLRDLLHNGEVSINKLARIRSIATPENQVFLAEQVRILPQKAVETLVRDEKFLRAQKATFETGMGEEQNLFSQGHQNFGGVPQLNLSPKTFEKLLHLQRCGHNLDQLLGEFLDQREQKIQQEKRAIVEEQENQEYEHEWVRDWRKTLDMAMVNEVGDAIEMTTMVYIGEEMVPQNDKPAMEDDVEKKLSRYIKVRIRNVLHQEFGTKCAIYHCPNPAEEIHHTDRFSLSGRHNPYFLAPLCRGHHVRAHAVDLKVQQRRAESLILM